MRSLLILIVLAVTTSFAFTQISFSVCSGGPTVFTCDDSPPNPDLTGIREEMNNNNLTIDILPGAIVDTSANDTSCIETGNGNNQVTVTRAEMLALGDDDNIETGDGNDKIDVQDSTLRCDDDCINTFGGDDVITVIRSIVASLDNNGINATGGNNTVTVIDSKIIGGPDTGDNFGILFGQGNDIVTVNNSLVFGEDTDGQDIAISLGLGDDTLRLETGSRIEGFIDCGEFFSDEDDLGSLIFAMDVPLELLPIISTELASKDPREDSITINGLLYEWEDCSEIVNELNGVRNIRPIPTLSEWGLIAMAGILGLAGLMFAVRKTVTT